MVRIVILGGGFGGIRTALDLEKKLKNHNVSLTLVDRNNYQAFTPNLYEVASAYGIKRDNFSIKLKRTICIPFSDIFEDKKISLFSILYDGITLSQFLEMIESENTNLRENSQNVMELLINISTKAQLEGIREGLLYKLSNNNPNIYHLADRPLPESS